MEAGEGYAAQMGQYPVLNLTLKSAKQESFEKAYYMIQKAVAVELERHRSMIWQGRERIPAKDYESYLAIAEERATEAEVRNALQLHPRPVRVRFEDQ